MAKADSEVNKARNGIDQQLSQYVLEEDPNVGQQWWQPLSMGKDDHEITMRRRDDVRPPIWLPNLGQCWPQ